MLDKLYEIEARFDRLTQELSDPEVIANTGRFQQLARDHSELDELVANSEGVFSALGNASHHGCFTRVVGSVPYPYGGQAYSAAGRYLNGGSPLHSVYRWWTTDQNASESDAISPASGLITSGHISVASGAGLGGFNIDFSNAFPSSAPPAPQISLCR